MSSRGSRSYTFDVSSAIDEEHEFAEDSGDDLSEDDDESHLSVPTTVASNEDMTNNSPHFADGQKFFSSKITLMCTFLFVAVIVSVAMFGFAQVEAQESFDQEVSWVK